MNESLIASIQAALQQEKIDGWLFYGFRGSDPIAEHILNLDSASFATRRWFYYVPASGEPQRIVHAIETHTLDSLPGAKTNPAKSAPPALVNKPLINPIAVYRMRKIFCLRTVQRTGFCGDTKSPKRLPLISPNFPDFRQPTLSGES